MLGLSRSRGKAQKVTALQGLIATSRLVPPVKSEAIAEINRRLPKG